MTDYSLALVTPPALEPVTLDELYERSHLSRDDEDATMSLFISAARQAAETRQRRSYIAQVWEMVFDRWPEMPLDLPRPPLIELLSIKYRDVNNTETVLYDSITPAATNGDFIIDTASQPGRIALASGVSWPGVELLPIGGLRIRYRTGYGETAENIPDTVKAAIIWYCTYASDNRSGEAPEPPKVFYDLLDQKRIFQ